MITIHQRYRQTDRQTTCNRNTALCTKVHRAVKSGVASWAHYCECRFKLTTTFVVIFKLNSHFYLSHTVQRPWNSSTNVTCFRLANHSSLYAKENFQEILSAKVNFQKLKLVFHICNFSFEDGFWKPISKVSDVDLLLDVECHIRINQLIEIGWRNVVPGDH